MSSGGGAAGFLGMGLGMMGSMQAGAAERNAVYDEASRRRAQAQEELRKTRLNLSAFKKKAEIALGENISSYAKAGVDISESPLLQLAQTKSELGSQAADIERTGLENARLLMSGASNLESQAKQMRRAEQFQMAGTALGGAGSLMGRG